jgi:hypothetical protein
VIRRWRPNAKHPMARLTTRGEAALAGLLQILSLIQVHDQLYSGY